MTRDQITTLFDLVGSVLLAVGLGVQFLWPLWWGFAIIGVSTVITGCTLLVQSRIIIWVAEPKHAPRWWRKLRGGEQ